MKLAYICLQKGIFSKTGFISCHIVLPLKSVDNYIYIGPTYAYQNTFVLAFLFLIGIKHLLAKSLTNICEIFSDKQKFNKGQYVPNMSLKILRLKYKI